MFEEVKEMIDSTIYTNGRGEVTAQNINLAMHGMVDATEEKFGEVEQTVTALGERVEGIAENGAGGSGTLRVWINEGRIGQELTAEQIAENIATYNALMSGACASVICCSVLDLDSAKAYATIPASAEYITLDEVLGLICIYSPDLEKSTIATIVVVLSADGTVEVSFGEERDSSGVVFYTTNTGEVSEEQKAKNVAAFNKYAAGIPVSVIVNNEGHEATYYPFVVAKDETSELSLIGCSFPMKVSNGDYAAMLFYEDGSVVMQME